MGLRFFAPILDICSWYLVLCCVWYLGVIVLVLEDCDGVDHWCALLQAQSTILTVTATCESGIIENNRGTRQWHWYSYAYIMHNIMHNTVVQNIDAIAPVCHASDSFKYNCMSVVVKQRIIFDVLVLQIY